MKELRASAVRGGRRLLLVLLLGSGCGSSRAAPTHHEATAPVDGGAPLSKKAAEDDCTRACTRFQECGIYPAEARGGCIEDCVTRLRTPAGYADCIAGLSCEEMQASVLMNSGPTGNCYEQAR